MRYTMLKSVWLAPVKGLAKLIKKKYPDAEILEGTFEPFERVNTTTNWSRSKKEFTHKNILVQSAEFKRFWIKYIRDDFPYGDMPRFGEHFYNARMEYFSNKLFKELSDGKM